MNPLVSLITPFFNAMPYFRDYLGCVLRQTWRPLEFIAVDDGSSDGSWDCLMEFLPELERAGIAVRTLRIAHAGQAAAVSAALPLMSGEYLTWCDADDRRTQNVFDALFRGTTYCCRYMVRASLLFASYPDRRIPLSPEGQNLQLLLPPASRSNCGFLLDLLHFYYRRKVGHSSQKLTFHQAYARLEHFSALRQAILPHCLCDAEHYLEEDRKLTGEAQRALCLTAAAQARKEIRT